MRVFFIFMVFINCYVLQAGVVKDTIYINRASDTLYSQQYYFISFNPSSVFLRTNSSYAIEINDTLEVVLINTDSVFHSFTIDTILTGSNVVGPNDTIQLSVSFSQAGTYRFYSSLSNGWQLGASGVVSVGYSSHKTYSWNIFDTDSAFSSMFYTGMMTEIDSMYMPSLFSINGFSYPQTAFDSSTLITAMVGDTIIISVLNSGHMVHALHFHGFHVQVLTSSHTPNTVGWIKDSFPVMEGATMTLMMVPDKEGMYPIHDHNLIASTNAGWYPGGMMAMMDIMP